MVTAVATAPKVHVVVPGFQAFGEFHGYTTDCLVDAELMMRHPFDGSPLDGPTLNSWWQDCLSTGHADRYGAQLRAAYWHLTQSAHKLNPAKAVISQWHDVDTLPLDQLRVHLITALVQGQTAMVFLGNAQALAYNERGVFGHFVAIGGIDSDLGYYVGNGDDVAALGGHGIIASRWYSWAALAAAKVNGIIAIAPVKQSAPAPAPAPVPNPAESIPNGWHDDGTVLTAPNGVPVKLGFRSHILAGGWRANNTPFAAEYTVAGGGTRQDFLYGSLLWTPATNVIDAPIGQDYRTAMSALSTALDQTKTMQQRLAQIAQIVAAAK